MTVTAGVALLKAKGAGADAIRLASLGCADENARADEPARTVPVRVALLPTACRVAGSGVIVRAVETLTVGVKLESARLAGVTGIVRRRFPVAPESSREAEAG